MVQANGVSGLSDGVSGLSDGVSGLSDGVSGLSDGVSGLSDTPSSDTARLSSSFFRSQHGPVERVCIAQPTLLKHCHQLQSGDGVFVAKLQCQSHLLDCGLQALAFAIESLEEHDAHFLGFQASGTIGWIPQ